jgi:hypothetical protein
MVMGRLHKCIFIGGRGRQQTGRSLEKTDSLAPEKLKNLKAILFIS